MVITTLKLSHFRNHRSTTLSLDPGVNLFVGANGQGKTSILEAIFFAAFARSFVPGRDAMVVQRGYERAGIELQATRDNEIPYWVALEIPVKGRKKITTSAGRVVQAHQIIGHLPLVVLAPDHRAITVGSPVYRRRFLNTLLSQSNPRYLQALWRYHQVLKQRNTLLATYRRTGEATLLTQLESWDEPFVQYAAEITYWRYQFIVAFLPVVQQYYRLVSNREEEIEIRYWSHILQTTELPSELTVEAIAAELWQHLSRLRAAEERQGKTLIGPQRDDLQFFINQLPFRQSASQGQHKSLLISLKFAEWEYLQAQFGERPIALFDDIFSELDEQRVQQVLDLLVPNTQLMITTTDRRIQALLPAAASAVVYQVQNGQVTLQEVVAS